MTPRPCAPPPGRSGRLLVRLAPGDVALFRFLLEAYENLAIFTTLERRTALLKVLYSPQQEDAVRAALAEISECVPLMVEDWPFGTAEGDGQYSPLDRDKHQLPRTTDITMLPPVGA